MDIYTFQTEVWPNIKEIYKKPEPKADGEEQKSQVCSKAISIVAKINVSTFVYILLGPNCNIISSLNFTFYQGIILQLVKAD